MISTTTNNNDSLLGIGRVEYIKQGFLTFFHFFPFFRRLLPNLPPFQKFTKLGILTFPTPDKIQSAHNSHSRLFYFLFLYFWIFLFYLFFTIFVTLNPWSVSGFWIWPRGKWSRVGNERFPPNLPPIYKILFNV